MRERPDRASRNRIPRAFALFPLIFLLVASAVSAGEGTRGGALDLFYSGEYSRALEAFASLIPADDRGEAAAESAYWMGACLVKLERFEDALRYLQSAQSRDASPDVRRRALLLSGMALEEMGRDAEAVTVYGSLLPDPGAETLVPEVLFRLAGIWFRAGRYEPARESYSRIVLDYPRSGFVSEALFFLAEAEVIQGDKAAAERRYLALLSTYPDSKHRETSRLRLAEIALASGKSGDALRLIDGYRKQYPKGTLLGSAMRMRGAILRAMGRSVQSIDAYEAALGLLAGSREEQAARYELAAVLLADGRKSEAVPHFEAALAGAERSIVENSLAELSGLYAELGQVGRALSVLTRLAEEFPLSAMREETLFRLAGLLNAGGEIDESRRRLDTLVSEFPGSPRMPEYLYHRGIACLDSGDQPSALESFQRLSRDFPRSDLRGQSLYMVGYIYALQREYPRAIPYLQAVRGSSPAAELLRRSEIALGACQFNMGDYRSSFLSFDSLIGKSSDPAIEADLFFDSARSLYRLGRFGDSAERFRRASELYPGTAGAAEARYWLGWSDFHLERFDSAKGDFLAVAELFPTYVRAADSLLQAAICSIRLGDDSDAAAILDRALAAAAATGSAGIREKALYEKGSALARLGRRSESELLFNELAKDYPTGKLAAEAFFREAAELRDRRRYGDALSGFLKVYRSFPSDPLAAQALYWAAETSLQAGDAEGSAALFWEYILEFPEGSFLSLVLDGLERAFMDAESLELSSQYREKARLDPQVSSFVLSSVELDYAALALSRNPEETRAAAEEVSKRMLPESMLREAGLLLGKYSVAKKQWTRAKEILIGLASSRGDRVSALARLEYAGVLRAEGNASDAMQVFASISALYPAFPDLAAEGLYQALLLARSRGDSQNAAIFMEKLKNNHPQSPRTVEIGPLRNMK